MTHISSPIKTVLVKLALAAETKSSRYDRIIHLAKKRIITPTEAVKIMQGVYYAVQ